jgi:hypothetical protein
MYDGNKGDHASVSGREARSQRIVPAVWRSLLSIARHFNPSHRQTVQFFWHQIFIVYAGDFKKENFGDTDKKPGITAKAELARRRAYGRAS